MKVGSGGKVDGRRRWGCAVQVGGVLLWWWQVRQKEPGAKEGVREVAVGVGSVGRLVAAL